MDEEKERGGPASSEPRVFRDEREQDWEVRAIHPTQRDRRSDFVRADYANGWLLFTLGLERRRLAPLPVGWQSAPESQLAEWCAEAKLVENSTMARGDDIGSSRPEH